MTTFSISRSTSIEAPADRIQPHIADLHNWVDWSPWQDADPTMSQIYSGAEAGEGAQMHWKGNSKAGEGSMRIVTATASRVEVALTFIKPFAAENRSVFTLTPQEDAPGTTCVTWTMSGTQNAFTRIIFRVLGMEKKISADFDKGLGRLKAISESGR